MIRAWRRPDGRYWLEAETQADEARARRHHFVCGEGWSCRPDQLGEIDAQRVYGVITGPSSCGHEPAMFRWVTESDVRRGCTGPDRCVSCASGAPRNARGFAMAQDVYRECEIIDVCGEADVAEAVYNAEFRSKVEAAS